MKNITIELPWALESACRKVCEAKGWPIKPEELFALLALRQLDELGALERAASKELEDLGLPRLGYLALGPLMKNLREEAEDMVDLALDEWPTDPSAPPRKG